MQELVAVLNVTLVGQNSYNMKEKNIHWYPGHMKKAQDKIMEKIKLVDLVIEVLDARAPFASRNNIFRSKTINKQHLIILNKADLATVPEQKVKDSLKITPLDRVISLSSNDKKSYNIVSKNIIEMGKAKNEKLIAKGMKPQPIRAIIFGIPNVGKSTLINLLSKKKMAGVANTPGFTKGEQWIKVNENFELLDTPGVLPTKYEDNRESIKLALIGSIKEEILPKYDLCKFLFSLLKTKYPSESSLFFKFDIINVQSYDEFVALVCNNKKFFIHDEKPDTNRFETYLLKEFKSGNICNVYLD